jgi:hypothetical protein
MRKPFEGPHEDGEAGGIVHVLLAMQGGEIVAPGRRTLHRRTKAAGAAEVLNDGVHHDVPHAVDAAPYPFVAQVPDRGQSRTEKEARDVIRQAAVDLFGHPVVEAAQAGLDVGHRDAELGGGQGARERGVRIAEDHDHVRAVLEHGRLERLEHAAGHPAMRAGADAQVAVGSGDAELVEEGLGHLVVVVLTRVDEQLPHPPSQGSRERRRFHELRPGSHHGHHDGTRPGGPHRPRHLRPTRNTLR